MSALNLGLAQAGAGRLDAALQNVRRATDSWEQGLGAEHPRMMEARTALSVVLLDRGDVPGAISQAEIALRIGRKAFGAQSPQCADSLLALARALDAAGKLDEALAAAEQALAILEKSPDANRAGLANALDAVGKARLRQGHSEAALAPLERALEVRQHLERDPADVQRTAFALAQVLWNIGKDRERAVTLARAAVTVFAQRPDCAADLTHASAWLKAHPR
jgi:serine/threonine-protein kinase